MTRPVTACGWLALAALASILAVTASWWALALWPLEPAAPSWILRTREVCFGTMANGLPNAGGWLLLVGQPLGMLVLLAGVWSAELRAGIDRLTSGLAGRLAAGLVVTAVVVGLAATATRVARASGESFAVRPDTGAGTPLVRLNDSAPEMALLDQRGQTVTLQAFRGQPVLVTFAYAHCETICPVVVNEVLAGQRQAADLRPVVLIVTLDPWRDTPSRLESIAAAWHAGAMTRVLSGAPADVDRVLNAWRIPRVRNERTGDLSHPSVVYVVGPDGKITYAVEAQAETIAAALRAL